MLATLRGVAGILRFKDCPGAVTNSDGGEASRRLPEGLCELLKTEGLVKGLSKVPDLEARYGQIDDEDAPDILSRHVSDAVRRLSLVRSQLTGSP